MCQGENQKDLPIADMKWNRLLPDSNEVPLHSKLLDNAYMAWLSPGI